MEPLIVNFGPFSSSSVAMAARGDPGWLIFNGEGEKREKKEKKEREKKEKEKERKIIRGHHHI